MHQKCTTRHEQESQWRPGRRAARMRRVSGEDQEDWGYGLEIQYERIAAELTADGTPSPEGHAVWSHDTVCYILQNPAYTGTGTWGRRTNTRSKNGKRSQRLRRAGAPLAEMTYPRIVSDELWEAANSVSLCVTAVRAPVERYLLRGGMVRCAEHDRVMTGATSGSGYGRYRCQQQPRGLRAQTLIHSVSAAKLEAAVWGELLAFLADPDRGRRGVNDLLAQRARDVAAIEAERAQRLGRRAVLEAKADALLDLYTEWTITRERLDTKVAQIEAQIKDVDAQTRRTEARLALLRVDIPDAQEVAEACRQLSKGAYYADAAGKRELLDAVQLRVYVAGEQWWAEGIVPGLRLEGRIAPSRWVHEENAWRSGAIPLRSSASGPA